MNKWPIKYRLWRFLHLYANRLAWKFANPSGDAWGKALRIDHSNFWWRLNDWLGGHYTLWWAKEGRKLNHPPKQAKPLQTKRRMK